jgi:hypothetical protein
LDVLDAVEGLAEFFEEAGVLHEGGDDALAGFDGFAAAERVAEPASECAFAHGGDAVAEGGEEGAFGAAGSEGSLDFEASERGLIDDEVIVAGEEPGGLQVRDFVFFGGGGGLGFEQVVDDGGGGAECGVVVREAEALECTDAELVAKGFDGLALLKGPKGSDGEGAVERWGELADGVEDDFFVRGWVGVGVFGEEDFAWGDASEFVGEFFWGEGGEGKGAGAQFGPGDGDGVVGVGGDGGEGVFAGFVEEGFVGECAWGDESCDFAADDAFGLCGVFHLIADGDAVSGVDHASEVAFDAVVRDAGHGDALGSLGEGDAEDFVGELGVVEEQFVEIAHAEEEDAVGVQLLEAAVLPHGGGVWVFRGGFHGGHGSGAVWEFLVSFAVWIGGGWMGFSGLKRGWGLVGRGMVRRAYDGVRWNCFRHNVSRRRGTRTWLWNRGSMCRRRV